MLEVRLDCESGGSGGSCTRGKDGTVFDLACSSCVRLSTSISSSICSPRVGIRAIMVYVISSWLLRNLRFKLGDDLE